MGRYGSLIMGIGFLVLVIVIVLVLFNETSTFDDFSKYWGVFGTIVGVVTGAIPSFFFKAQADSAQQEAAGAKEEAKKESAKAELYAGVADKAEVARLQAEHPAVFRPDR